MGWRLHRVWSVEWFYDRENAIRSMLRSIEQALASDVKQSIPASNPQTAAPDPEEDPDPVVQPVPKPTSRTHGSSSHYRRFRPSRRGNRDVLLNDSHRLQLAKDVAAIVNAEGPLHKELLLERLMEFHKVERAGSNVEGNFKTALQYALRGKMVARRSEKNFIWPVGRNLSCFRTPGDEVFRTLELIPREEIELAVLFLVEDQFGMIREYVPQGVARLFGIERLSADGADRIRDVVDRLIEKGLLRVSGHHVYVA